MRKNGINGKSPAHRKEFKWCKRSDRKHSGRQVGLPEEGMEGTKMDEIKKEDDNVELLFICGDFLAEGMSGGCSKKYV